MRIPTFTKREYDKNDKVLLGNVPNEKVIKATTLLVEKFHWR